MDIIQIKYNSILIDAISLYYGLYDINYKIHNDYKNMLLINSSFESTINYLNDINLANKCFNECFSIDINNNKYCRKINNNKCVPKCEQNDSICLKTILNVNYTHINNYNNKTINSSYDGNTNFIYKIIPLIIDKTTYFIIIIKNSLYKIIMFPSGYRYSKLEFEKYINFDNLYNILFDSDNEKNNYILCGHSMGCVLLQILITQTNFIKNNNLISRCVIIGSGAYLWCNTLNIINFFIKMFNSRYMFIGQGLFIKEAKENVIDDYLFSKGLSDDIDNIKLYSFPTNILVNTGIIKNNILETNNKHVYFIDLQIIISYKKKYKIYGKKIFNNTQELNDTIIFNDIKPKNNCSITDVLNYQLIDIHSWNIYSKSILFLLNL
jgi:hypothetical protein